MPLPLILGIGAALAGAAGVASGVRGGVKMKEANDTLKAANSRHQRNQNRFKEHHELATKTMDDLGKLELKILASFETFSALWEQIDNAPDFEEIVKDGINIPEYDGEALKTTSVGAGVLLGGLGGAAVGTAAGFASAGATTAAVMALGTASTGTAIASLSGIAATNATLAALGGGAIAAGGGGIALGTTILGAATFGVGLLAGGIIFNITGSSLSSKADEAWDGMKKAEREIDKTCNYLSDLNSTASRYSIALMEVDAIYQIHIEKLRQFIIEKPKTFKKDRLKVDYKTFSVSEKAITKNTPLLVGLLYQMCKVQFVLKSKDEKIPDKINHDDIRESINNEENFVSDLKSQYRNLKG